MKNLIMFLDPLQRTIVAELVSNNEETLVVSNPLIVHIDSHRDHTGSPTGQMSIQLLPAYFKEFAADKTADHKFTYSKCGVTMINVDGQFDFKLYSLYDQITGFTPKPAAAEQVTPVKLFED